MNGRRPSEAVARARALLDGLGGKPLSSANAAATAVQVAASIWEAAEARKGEVERQHAELLGRLMNDPAGQAFSNLVADRAYRSHDAERLVAQTQHLLEALGTPRYMTATEKLQLGALRAIGSAFPKAVARGMHRTLRQKTRAVILSSREPGLSEHLVRRRDAGVRMNLNWLGEAVLGRREAERRVEQYAELLAHPNVEAVSVKVSTLTSQLRLLAWDATLQRLRPRLRAIYRAALRHGRRGQDGRTIPKLVNLDMEAYRDLHVTLDLFCSVLGEPEFRDLTAGIALQSYLPDSFPLQRELTAWARARVATGGAPIRLRIVKGANLAAERVEASLRGWAVPVYRNKDEVDGNFKRMLAFGCWPENVHAVHLGIASHNVFDLAYAMTLGAQRRVQQYVGFELLEGMADHLQRTIREVAGDVLLYGPVVDEHAMQTAIAYLIRRLDENTAEDNFLRHSFAMRVGDLSWHAQRRRFLRTCRRSRCVSSGPRRRQDRNLPEVAKPQAQFTNEPDTDFTLACNREWIRDHLDRCSTSRFEVPMQIAGTIIHKNPLADGFDPSRPGVVPYTHPLATAADVEHALAAAQHAVAAWAATTPTDRAKVMAGIAQRLRTARGELIAAIVLDASKCVEEADAEVSEAIDFAEYYRRCGCELYTDRSVRAKPKGVALVTPPWNFPLAIPAGSTLAALAAGNPVILKPALETPLVAERFARICWKAGVPQQVLQVILCADKIGSRLVANQRVKLALLTGATSTAQLFSELHPALHLIAETGGKNPIIITDMSDRDAAVQAAVASAFRHAGQKCSAASLLICEPAVYDDPAFLDTLRDAAASLPVGSAWDPDSVVTPLIHPPQGALLRGLTRLERGETWLLKPRSAPHNPRLWSPGIKLGVREGSFSHTTELFGPVLGVMRAANLAEAVRTANATPYGLTAGLQSLDEREQLFWLEHMRAGNLYVNRGTTGAIVQRQPFGGYQASCFGPGAKAGGPNYVAQLVDFSDRKLPQERGTPPPIVDQLMARLYGHLQPAARLRLRLAAGNYAWALEQHFGRDHDPSQVLGQVNVFCYRPLQWLLLRVAKEASPSDVALVCAAALTCSEEFQLSVAPSVLKDMAWLRELPGAKLRIESAGELACRLRETSGYYRPTEAESIERIRLVGRSEEQLLQAARYVGVHVAAEPPLLSGRWELRHYVREQSISIDYHRHGNLAGARLLPVRAEATDEESPEAADAHPADVASAS